MPAKITCHMVTSLDGRLHPKRWRAADDPSLMEIIHRVYDACADVIGYEGWIVGRKTMAEYVGEIAAPALLEAPAAREPFIGARGARNLAIAIDPSGRLTFDTDDVDGDHAVVVLSERVTDDALSALRAHGVSYVFAGADGRDINAAIATISERFGVTHLMLQGGAVTNGAFLAAGLIDEVSTLICPAIDGLSGEPATFEREGPEGSRPAAGQTPRLLSCETLDGGLVWLRHAIDRA